MTWQLVYWITRFDAINVFAIVSVVLGGISGLFCFMHCSIEEEMHNLGRWLRIPITILLIGILLFLFIPSTKEACAIYLIPKIINNEQVQHVPEKALRLLNAKFDEWIDEQMGDDNAKQD